MKHEEPCWMTSNGERVQGRAAVVLALLEMFSDEDIPNAFRCNGQTWQERAEAWAMHAIGELDQELWEFRKDVEFKGTIEGLAHDYPGTVDYHTENGEWFQLLDKDDNVIATISEREMMGYMGA